MEGTPSDNTSYGTTAEALRTNTERFGRSVLGRYFDILQVWLELATGNASDFGSHAAQVFGFAARFH